jgi:hypothetical protein
LGDRGQARLDQVEAVEHAATNSTASGWEKSISRVTSGLPRP